MSPHTNRRRYPRLPTQCIVRLERCRRPRTQIHATIKDISLGGVRVALPTPFPVGDAILLQFSVPILGRPTTIEAVGTVAWSATSEMALEFDNLSTRPREALVEYLQIMERATQAETALRELDESEPPPAQTR